MNKHHKGIFITLEGIEGAGKSTHAAYLADLLQQHGHKVLVTREPGGTAFGEQVRAILLQHNALNINAMSELLLMFAARAQHIAEIIRPALAQGKTVICDRFTDSSYAYQGGGRKISFEHIRMLANLVHPQLTPGLTLLFDVKAETGLARVKAIAKADRFESENMDFFTAVRTSYLELAEAEPDRIKIINADQGVDVIQTEIRQIMEDHNLW